MKSLIITILNLSICLAALSQHTGMNMPGSNTKAEVKPTGVTKQYDLYVNDTTVNYTGRRVHAIAINGQIPGPTVEFTEGDTAVINVHNLMNVTNVHSLARHINSEPV